MSRSDLTFSWIARHHPTKRECVHTTTTPQAATSRKCAGQAPLEAADLRIDRATRYQPHRVEQDLPRLEVPRVALRHSS